MFGRPGHFKNGKSQIWAKFKKIIGPMMALTIGTNNGRKICPWWAPGLGNHFGSKFTWILKKFNFCCRYQPNILKRAWDVAFGLNFHVEKSFFEKFLFVYIFWFFIDFWHFMHFWYAWSENMPFFQLRMMYHGQTNKTRQ